MNREQLTVNRGRASRKDASNLRFAAQRMARCLQTARNPLRLGAFAWGLLGIILLSCQDPVSGHKSVAPQDIPAGMGCVTISVETAGARTILPATPGRDDVTLYRIAFESAEGGAAYTEDRLPVRLSEPVYLEPGTYTLTLTAFIGTDKPAAQGSASGVAINAGGSTPVTVTLRAINAAGLSGSFKYTVGFPADTTAVTLKLTPLNDTGSVVSDIDLLAGVARPAMGTLSLNTGYYNVAFTLEKEMHRLVWRELLHVYANLDSIFTRTFTNDDFHRSGYTVTFCFNNGDADGAASVLHGGAANKPADPSGKSSGRVFDGWYIDDTFGNEYDFDEAVINDITLYAKWAPYNVILIDGGGHEAGYGDLAEALDKITTAGKYTVEIYADQPSFAPYTLSIEGADITLIAPLDPVTISLSDTGSLFTIKDSVSLTLNDGIILRGRVTNNIPLVRVDVGGIFIMNGGKITGNTNSSSSSGSNGGGVYVTGIFIMHNGEISGNTTTNPSTGYGNGAGVYVNYNGTFTMYDGKISSNTSGNDGGGVDVDGIFTMYGGEIFGNTCGDWGGGVRVYTHGTFIMHNGKIFGNISPNEGGGVYIYNGTFTMTNGTISDNTASNNGGGVYVSSTPNTNFNLGGTAVIKDNTIDTSANNVYLADGKFINLIADSPPAPDMEVWVQTATPSGVIVNEGATADIVPYFHADNGKGLYVNNSGQLVISGASNVTVDNGSSETGHLTLAAALGSITTAGTYTVRIFTSHSTPPR